MDKIDKTWMHYFNITKNGQAVESSIFVSADNPSDPRMDVFVGKERLYKRVPISDMMLNNGILESHARKLISEYGQF